MTPKPTLVLVACSAYRPELEHFIAAGQLHVEVRYLDSALHMQPGLLTEQIELAVAEARAQQLRVVLLFGDCAGELTADTLAHVDLVACENCAQALLGRDGYRRTITERACCLFHEWAMRWREVLGDIPGLGPELTTELVHDSHRQMIYLDTGVAPVPEAELAACSAHFGLPVAVLPVPLAHFERLLRASGLLTEEAP